MIYKAALKYANIYAHKHYITSENVETVAYGFFSLFSNLIFGLISLGIGVLFNNVIGSLVFYSVFLFIKKFAGGIHATTEKRCFFYSSISILGSLVSMHLGLNFKIYSISLILISLVLSVCVYKYAPIASKERPLDEAEIKKYSKIVKTRILFLVLIMIVSDFIGFRNISLAIASAIILESLLIIAGKAKEEKNIHKCAV